MHCPILCSVELRVEFRGQNRPTGVRDGSRGHYEEDFRGARTDSGRNAASTRRWTLCMSGMAPDTHAQRFEEGNIRCSF